MKRHMISTNKLLAAAFCAAMLALSPNASALTIGDAHELGFVDPSTPTTVHSATLFVNTMIDLGLGHSTHVIVNGHDNLVTRSNHAFHPLPTAVFALTGHGRTIDLGTGLYSYLFAKYNFGAEVWDVRDLSGIIHIPAGVSLWKLFGPGVTQVPDGGATVMLLGAAITVLGTARRFLTS